MIPRFLLALLLSFSLLPVLGCESGTEDEFATGPDVEMEETEEFIEGEEEISYQ